MTTYIAFLRGINVGGHKIIKMTELKEMFETLGYKNVRTYIQSGNVKFEAGKEKPDVISNKITARLNKWLGYEVTVVIRTQEQIGQIIKGYPFSKVRDHDKCNIHVAFLSAEPAKSVVKELTSLSCDEEVFNHKGCNVYILLRGGTANSLTGKNIIEKKLKVRATVRNWNTVNKMLTL